MKLVSLNVGLPRFLTWQGETFETGIFKDPVNGRVMLRSTNLDGDRQADLTVHGGPNKAVSLILPNTTPAWKAELPKLPISLGEPSAKTSPLSGLLETNRIHRGPLSQSVRPSITVTTPQAPLFQTRRQDSKRREADRTASYIAAVAASILCGGRRGRSRAPATNSISLNVKKPTLTVAEVNGIYVR